MNMIDPTGMAAIGGPGGGGVHPLKVANSWLAEQWKDRKERLGARDIGRPPGPGGRGVDGNGKLGMAILTRNELLEKERNEQAELYALGLGTINLPETTIEAL
ncbi:MAG TPA: hypothetical protein VD772_01910, partial [Anseongella sp.]|nr:hypothetical protein [Anseongella sp.]